MQVDEAYAELSIVQDFIPAGNSNRPGKSAAATGVLPLDYMLSVMRDSAADNKRRDAMAIAAAPYRVGRDRGD